MSTQHEQVSAMPSVASVRGEMNLAPSVPAAAADAKARSRRLQRFVRTSITPYLSRQAQYVGRTGVAGLGLLVFAVAFFLGANLPLKSELVELRTRVDTAREARSSARANVSPDADARAFMSRLPPRGELPRITEQIVAQAATAGVALERGSYDFTTTASKHLVRARMSFPVHGRYRDIRRFVDGTLAAVPAAAVDGLRLQRKEIGDNEIDAEIRFAIYVRSAP